PRDAWIRTIAIAFAATGGTSFHKADLTDADFTGATLKSTDLREANVTRTCWQNTIKLDRARPGKTILADTAVRELLVSGNGYNKSYVDANLRGANLKGANLNKANLRLADISEATLEDANLEWAILTEAQAIGTDFTHAYLTGACLEACNIDSTTRLTNIDCQYVFLLETANSQGSRERRPHHPDRVFQPGDFEKLYKKIINTVQILLRNGVNPEAFRQAFQKIMAENPEITHDSIQAIEKKGNDVLLTLEIPEATDKGKFERQFLAVYEARLEAAKQTALLEAERSHNQDIKEFVRAALTSHQSLNPIISLTNTAKADSDMSDKSQSFNIGNIDQSQAANPTNFNIANDNARQVNTNNFTPEQTQSLAEAAAEIQQLLNQLSQTNPTTTNKEKMIVVGEVVDQIETNPTLKNKVINALKAGGVEAFKEAIDHPLVNILMATIDGWTEV
ncbi:MAG: pentapeptide repeat-containing protein, partial [Moorea sp. SIO3G5]|nr:pentapeptide repeat-containing protein [Moorena sp. SIO3G5]